MKINIDMLWRREGKLIFALNYFKVDNQKGRKSDKKGKSNKKGKCQMNREQKNPSDVTGSALFNIKKIEYSH